MVVERFLRDDRVEAILRELMPFISETVRRALDDERRWDDIEASLGSLAGQEHDWDDDPAAWVTAQRSGDPNRVG